MKSENEKGLLVWAEIKTLGASTTPLETEEGGTLNSQLSTLIVPNQEYLSNIKLNTKQTVLR